LLPGLSHIFSSPAHTGREGVSIVRTIFRLAVLILILVAIVYAAALFSLSAVNDPGRVETYLAAKARHFLVRRSSNEGISPEPASTPASIKEGDTLYGTECAACHGMDGRKLTDAGRWMYPRAADLTAPDVQQYSDAELFWIVKNGIRFSGMPAFAKVESDEHIWDLVHYLRTLPHPNLPR